MAGRTDLYVGTDQGLLVARRGEASTEWHLVRRTLEGRSVSQVVLDAGGPGHLAVAVRGEGVFQSADGGHQWLLTLPSLVACLVPDPHEPPRLYAGLSARYSQEEGSGLSEVMLSPDGGETWQPLARLPGAPGETSVLALAVSRVPLQPPVLWAGLSAGSVAALYDPAAPWEWRRVGLDPAEPITHLAVLRARPPRLYATGVGGVYTLDLSRVPGGPLGATGVWQRGYRNEMAYGGPPGPHTPLRIIAVGREGGPATLLVSDAHGVLWAAGEQAEVWRQVNTGFSGLPISIIVTTLLADPLQPDSALLGTAEGQVYESTDRGAHWLPLSFAAGGSVQALAVARS